MEMCQILVGLPPQTFGGGTQEGVETAQGQQQQLDQAVERIGMVFQTIKQEEAQADQNALECLQKGIESGLIKELYDVTKVGGDYKNKDIPLNKLCGEAYFAPDEDQGLPQSQATQRQIYQKLFEESGGPTPNPLALEMFGPVENQNVIMTSLGGADLVLPKKDQLTRTLEHINIILDPSEAMFTTNPQTGQLVPDLPVQPEIGTDAWATLLETLQQFKQKNWRMKQSNPLWPLLDKYREMALQLQTQESVQNAQRDKAVKMAAAPDPDPMAQKAKALMIQDGANALARNEAIGSIDPLTAATAKIMPSVMGANRNIIETAAKVADK